MARWTCRDASGGKRMGAVSVAALEAISAQARAVRQTLREITD